MVAADDYEDGDESVRDREVWDGFLGGCMTGDEDGSGELER